MSLPHARCPQVARHASSRAWRAPSRQRRCGAQSATVSEKKAAKKEQGAEHADGGDGGGSFACRCEWGRVRARQGVPSKQPSPHSVCGAPLTQACVLSISAEVSCYVPPVALSPLRAVLPATSTSRRLRSGKLEIFVSVRGAGSLLSPSFLRPAAAAGYNVLHTSNPIQRRARSRR